MPSDTRQRLLHSALWRFYRDGFRNVGLDQILEEVGISKTAFYKHFESKDDLMVAVLDERNSHMQQEFRTAVARRGACRACSGSWASGKADAGRFHQPASSRPASGVRRRLVRHGSPVAAGPPPMIGTPSGRSAAW